MPPSDGFIDSGSYPLPHKKPPPLLTTASWCGRISWPAKETRPRQHHLEMMAKYGYLTSGGKLKIREQVRWPQAGIFDHAIVHILSLDLFVDMTDRDPPLVSLPTQLYGKPGLLTSTGQQIVRLPVRSPERDFVETHEMFNEPLRFLAVPRTRRPGVLPGEA